MVKSFNLALSDSNDLITEVFKSKMLIVGSPTVGNSVLHSVAGFIHMVKQMKFKGKKAASFGCHGWSGGAVKYMDEQMKEAGFEVLTEGLKNLWNPDSDAQKLAVEFGKKTALL